ncbi:flagellar protein FlaG [Bacillus pakistanensis]|uniref:Flagellar protein FlaG n=1 Tax=Rossellomorea pakistanensis TaxID=992288 RepID=A0ABS2NDI6_9BACI|nr:flagellar protein FlaG [Bacillus pakistanensis]MBM7585878.1 flagellar protein FlaG [Bacillus pakistanensis]
MIERIQNQSYASQIKSNFVERATAEKSSTEQVQSSNRENRKEEPVTKEKLENVVQGMNKFLQASNTHLKFEFHEGLQEYYVTIVDDINHEVIKEIPSKKLLDMHAAMTEFIGLMVDKKI